MTLNETFARIQAGHLMVRDAHEWDALSADLGRACLSQDEDLIEELRPTFLQSWRTVTRYVLRDTFDAAGIAVSEPGDAWGIATLTVNGASCEPLLSRPGAEAGSEGPLLLTFEETMNHYGDCLQQLLQVRSEPS